VLTAVLRWGARHLVVVLVGAMLVAAGAGACGDESSLLPDGGAPDGLEGLVSLSVTPPSADLTIGWGETATESFVATGTFADGQSRDVTALVGWGTTLGGAEVAAGAFASAVPGEGTVTASGGGQQASAKVTVRLEGEMSLPGTPADASDKLDGSPSGSATPVVHYPLDGALIPFNLGDTEVQIAKADPSQSLARLQLTGDLVDLKVLASCATIPGATEGCGVTITDELVPVLAGASEHALALRVRLAAADGSKLGESAASAVSWTFTEVKGGLYFWTARHNGATHIYRYDLDAKGAPPEDFFADESSPPLHDGTPKPCVGCHSVSLDGHKMGLTFGGSNPSDFALLDVATGQPVAIENTDQNGFATFSTFSPTGALVLTSLRGKLTLRAADATLAAQAELGGGATAGEALSHPFWSPDGKWVTFVGWVPGTNGASDSLNGDVVRGAQIFLAQADEDGPIGSSSTVLVGRKSGVTSYYPAISDDGQWLVFNRSRCDGTPTNKGYGEDPCDGYDDTTARVMLVPVSGGEPVDLGQVNGKDSWTNSWPRWAPTHGTFRGKSIYFLAFSSKRPYGLRLGGSNTGETPPQLWLAAVALSPGEPIGADPSFAPVWLPRQDEDMSSPTGNHVPQWSAKALPIPK
jgi:hypothetical protein